VTVSKQRGQMNISFQEEDGSPIETLDSLFLDCADMSMQKFKKDVIESNWVEELNFYERDLEFLKKKIEGIILV
jgi:hypothetical protein